MVGLVREAFKVSRRDRVQQRFVEQISLTFPFRVVEVFTDQLLLLHPRTLLVPRMRLLLGFFPLFPKVKKVSGWVRTRGRNWVDFNPWTSAAYGDSMSFDDDESETESESEVEEDALTRFADGFRPLRVCTPFLEVHMGRHVRICAFVDRCTFAHSWAELHPEASAHEHELASYLRE